MTRAILTAAMLGGLFTIAPGIAPAGPFLVDLAHPLPTFGPMAGGSAEARHQRAVAGRQAGPGFGPQHRARRPRPGPAHDARLAATAPSNAASAAATITGASPKRT